MTNLLSHALMLSALALAASPAAAQGAPWCFSESGREGSGAVSCTFYSYQQCLATLSGIGGSCVPNPYPSHGAPSPTEGRSGKRKPAR
jgi:Protein of unknown function (DUF3551)